MRRSRRHSAPTSGRVKARLWHLISQLYRGGRRLAPPVIGLAVLAFIGFELHAGWRFACRSPYLSVRHVELVGHQRALREDLLRRASVAVGHPLLTLDLDAMAMRLREHPWVERVTVRRRLPDKLKIELVEHAPALTVSLGQTFVVNREGALFKRFEVADGLALPLVTGLSVVGAKENPLALRAQLAQAVSLTEALRPHETIVGKLQEIHWDADSGWSLVARPAQFFGPELTRSPPPVMRGHLGFAPTQKVAALVASIVETRARGMFPKVIWTDFPSQLARIQVEPWDVMQLDASFAPASKSAHEP